ncbi:MAG: Wzz/FepE/Etk N-terminal domain-containing protein [Acetatifactor muris]|nr:Wzz/FepE/Etk N-terminal domain-containing protein [Acetatifactor muris]
MQNKENEDVVEVDIQELLGMLLHRLWLIAVCGLACGLAAFLISMFLITPQYESSTSVYILNKNDGNTITYSDVQLGSTLTKDYAQLITSRGVLEKVIESCGLEDTLKELSKRVEVEALSDTRLIVITVTDPDPVMACLIADEIRTEASARIQEVMDIEAVNTVDAANLPELPASPSVGIWTLMGVLIGMLLCIAVLTVRFLTDDTVKTSEDVEKYLELSTLAMIPVMEGEEAAKHRHNHRGERERKVQEYREEAGIQDEAEEEYEDEWNQNRSEMIEMEEL